MRPGRDVEHLSHSSAEVKKRVELRLYPLWDFMTCYREIFIFFNRCMVWRVRWCLFSWLSWKPPVWTGGGILVFVFLYSVFEKRLALINTYWSTLEMHSETPVGNEIKWQILGLTVTRISVIICNNSERYWSFILHVQCTISRSRYGHISDLSETYDSSNGF
jgi:hypothetical protein